MNTKIRDLIYRRDMAKAEYERLAGEIACAEKQCQHEWDDPKGKYDPLVREGYRVEALRAGSDSEPEYWVPCEVTPRWVRICQKCGRREETAQVTEVVTKTPKW